MSQLIRTHRTARSLDISASGGWNIAMVSLSDPDVDKLATIAAAISGVILVLYFVLTIGNGQPANAVVFILLLAGTGTAAWGAFRSRGRLTVLWLAASTLCFSGLIMIGSIGAPLLIAGILCGVSGFRALPTLLRGR